MRIMITLGRTFKSQSISPEFTEILNRIPSSFERVTQNYETAAGVHQLLMDNRHEFVSSCLSGCDEGEKYSHSSNANNNFTFL